jgi:hypothetical protein
MVERTALTAEVPDGFPGKPSVATTGVSELDKNDPVALVIAMPVDRNMPSPTPNHSTAC